MSKADYETDPIGHFGLALADYAHFTSPIRRYPDLAVHRILSAYLDGEKVTEMRGFAEAAAQAGTATEQRALQLERDCDDRYRAEWAKQHLGEDFEGQVSGVSDYGIYVMLPNTAEGMIAMEMLPDDEYTCDGFYAVRGIRTGQTFSLGQMMRVRCVRADVNSGQIDFVPM
jgi:ribonuclease R